MHYMERKSVDILRLKFHRQTEHDLCMIKAAPASKKGQHQGTQHSFWSPRKTKRSLRGLQ